MSEKTGCNGYAYVINYTDEINEVDKIFDNDGVKVDEFSLNLIDGTEIDFKKEGLNRLQFRNPNISSNVVGKL